MKFFPSLKHIDYRIYSTLTTGLPEWAYDREIVYRPIEHRVYYIIREVACTPSVTHKRYCPGNLWQQAGSGVPQRWHIFQHTRDADAVMRYAPSPLPNGCPGLQLGNGELWVSTRLHLPNLIWLCDNGYVHSWIWYDVCYLRLGYRRRGSATWNTATSPVRYQRLQS